MFDMNSEQIEHSNIPGRRWRNALRLAAQSHQHQLRKDGVTPYIAHPVRVSLTIVMEFGVTDEAVLAATLLHDVIEDVACDYDDVFDACGREVADIVAALSKDTRMEYERREQAYYEQIRDANWQVKLIKLADVFENFKESRETGISKDTIVRNLGTYMEVARSEPLLQRAVTHIEKVLPDFQHEQVATP
jgi:(p)ppGpp synthase/HD superfamily hydrolase